VVNDEVFRLIALDGEPTPSIIDVLEHAVSIGDMTKPWGYASAGNPAGTTISCNV